MAALALATAAQGAEIVGVGMVLQADPGGGAVRVRSVLPAGPAAKAGIKPGSLILSIDGSSTADKPIAECVSLIRGELHTKVSLGIVGPELRETNTITLTREAISIPNPPLPAPGASSPPEFPTLTGKLLPDLAPFGLNSTNVPPGQPLLVMLVDVEQRPSRRALKVLAGQAAGLRQRGIVLVILQAGAMSDDAFADWKREAAIPLPIASLKGDADRARAVLGAASLPWLILTDKARRVACEGFPVEDVEAKLRDLKGPP